MAFKSYRKQLEAEATKARLIEQIKQEQASRRNKPFRKFLGQRLIRLGVWLLPDTEPERLTA
jgi:hypothetical protein